MEIHKALHKGKRKQKPLPGWTCPVCGLGNSRREIRCTECNARPTTIAVVDEHTHKVTIKDIGVDIGRYGGGLSERRTACVCAQRATLAFGRSRPLTHTAPRRYERKGVLAELEDDDMNPKRRGKKTLDAFGRKRSGRVRTPAPPTPTLTQPGPHPQPPQPPNPKY